MVVAGYPVIYFKNYDYMRLFNGDFIRRSNAGHYLGVYEKIITVDTETFVYLNKDIGFVTDWTITIENDCCIYGNHVSDLIDTIDRICTTLHADDSHLVRFYVHNFPYDYVFLRNHFFQKWGNPDKSLAAKTHKYIFMKWTGQGIEFRDSLILTQRSLEKLCKDMGTTEKAVGTWDYKKFRTPAGPRTAKEIAYVCTDTISLCKALRKYINQRGFNVANCPLTNTGFIRTNARRRSRKDKKWRKQFEQMALTLEQYDQMLDCYHGGYTHANRYYVNQLIKEPVECYDFASSYIAWMCYCKFPMTNFCYTNNITLKDIMELKEDYAFSGYIRLKNLRLKKDCPMPPLAFSKAKVCLFPEAKSKKEQFHDNLDNGKIVNADLVIYPFTDPDLEVILSSYEYEWADVSKVMRATKNYLPEWFTDYLMELFFKKCTLKGLDEANYMISKGELNGMYGMTVQRIIQILCTELMESGDWEAKEPEDREKELEKFYRNKNSFMPYQWGVFITAYAQAYLFRLGSCCRRWFYSDTDSVKGTDWDHDKLNAFNQSIIELSQKRNIGVVEYNGKIFRLGIAEFDGIYSEFITMGSKRYCYRLKKDASLHLTVAGVPKEGIYCLDDDISNFRKGFIFKNDLTFRRNYRRSNDWCDPKWKMKTEYLFHDGINELTIDGCRIEYGCAIRLTDTEYELDHTIPYDKETGLPLPFEMEDTVYE